MKALSFAVLALFAFCLLKTSTKRIPYFAGPYRVILHRLVNTSEDFKSTGKGWLQLRATQVRGKQPQYYWGAAYASIPITDDMKVKVMMASRSNNQWKKNAFIFKFDKICTNAKKYAQSITDMFYGPDYDTSCPIKPMGYREIKNHSFEFKFPQFPIMPYGRYLYNFALISNGEVVAVGVADCEAVPRLD